MRIEDWTTLRASSLCASHRGCVRSSSDDSRKTAIDEFWCGRILRHVRRFGQATCVWFVALVLVAGCASTPTEPTARDRITELHLFGNPNALNLDGVPGPDGVGIRIFASTAARAQGVPIRQGTLEILMFDGPMDGPTPAAPRQTWSFRPKELEAFEARTSLGAGYQFALPWQEGRPRTRRVTVIARLHQPAAPVLESEPSSIQVGLR